jgi:hypothetical protein
MSLNAVRTMAADLPRNLAEQVIGYAESVDRALPEIFRDAHVTQTRKLADEVVFLAGVKKLQTLTASAFWTLDTSTRLLASADVGEVRIGGQDFSKGGAVYKKLQKLLADLDLTLAENDCLNLLRLRWPDVIRELARNGRR